MNEHEYINFTYSDKASFDFAKNVYNFLKTSREKNITNILDLDLTIFPKNSIEYFERNNNKKAWKFKDLVEFLQCDLDVNYLDIVERDVGKGCLTYESNGYPYGGPESLIVLLRSMNCIPTLVYDGIDTYSINWLTEYEFKFFEIKNEQKLETESFEKENSSVDNENVFNKIFSTIKKLFG